MKKNLSFQEYYNLTGYYPTDFWDHLDFTLSKKRIEEAVFLALIFEFITTGKMQTS